MVNEFYFNNITLPNKSKYNSFSRFKKLKPEKLKVEYRNNITKINPINNRRYTLTHSDKTENLFLTIGLDYAYDKINILRDEVFAQVKYEENKPIINLYIHINGNFSKKSATIRNGLFRRELPLILEAIRYGDRLFFETHKELDYAPIFIHFDSKHKEFKKLEYWGMLIYYKKN